MIPRSTLLRYGLVPVSVAAAMLLRWPLWPVLQGELAFLFLWPVVLFCAWYGGLGPGLLATALSATAAAFFLLEPRFSLAVVRPADLAGVAVFVSMSVLLTHLNEKLHREKRRGERDAEEIARQREWLRVSIASIGDAVIATDAAGRVSFLNPTAEAMTAWGREEARGQPLEAVFAIINEETRQPVENPVARVIREGVVVGLAKNTALIARDGTERPIEDSAAPIRADDGRIVGVILVFHDVSEKRRLDAALEERRREQTARPHFQTLFESSPGLFLVLKPDLSIVAVSDAYLSATMTRREDILGLGLFDVFPDNPGDPAATGVGNLRASLDRVRRDRTPDAMAVQKYDIRRRESEGGGFEERYWSPVNSPVFGPGGGIEYIIHRVEDVTEFVRRKPPGGEAGSEPNALRVRTEQMEAEIFQRGQELQRLNERLRGANEALSAEVAERTRAEESLRLLRDELEGRVRERTAALEASHEALRDSEEQFRTLADSIPQLAWTARPDGHIDWYNRRWYEYTGTTLGRWRAGAGRASTTPKNCRRCWGGGGSPSPAASRSTWYSPSRARTGPSARS